MGGDSLQVVGRGLYTRTMRRRRPVAFGVALLAVLASACKSPAEPSRGAQPMSPGAGVDVLAFLVGDPATWPRVGSHSQNQIVDRARQEVCWVKYANPRTFECWRWDDRYIYHEVDHGIDGNTGESYSLKDGRWMPRYLEGEWRLDVATDIVWFDPGCNIRPDRSGPFRYQ